MPTQTTLALTPAPPAGHLVTGIDPAKDLLWCATIEPAAVHVDMCGALLKVRFECIPWCTQNGWRDTCRLFGEQNAPAGFVLCESQWAGVDAAAKWSGLEPLCQTAGALRAAAAASGLCLQDVTHWSRNDKGVRHQGLLPLAAGRGLAFVEPSAWRSRALSPRPISPRARARTTEQRCAASFFGRRINADFSAAFGILLCAIGLNYSDLGVAV